MAEWSETRGRKNRALATERQRQALELHKAGVGYQAIADRLGYAGPSGAYKAVNAALQKTLQEPADELRTRELERLDRMHAALWPKAVSGHLRSVDRVLAIMARRSRLLGLDAPQRQHVAADLTLATFAEKAAAMSGLDSGSLLAEAERILAAVACEKPEGTA